MVLGFINALIDLAEFLLLNIDFFLYRSSHRRCSVRKGVLRNFAKFTGNYLRQSLYFNKVAGLRPEASNFIKIEALVLVFSYEFCEISKNNFLTEDVWRLLLSLMVTSFIHLHLLHLYGISLHKKWSFLLWIYSVNVSKSAGNLGFGHIYWKNLYWKTSFFVECLFI